MIPTTVDPGLRVLTREEAAKLLGVSVLCLDRMGNDGPRRIRLSARRVGFRVAHLQAWMESREEPMPAGTLPAISRPPPGSQDAIR